MNPSAQKFWAIPATIVIVALLIVGAVYWKQLGAPVNVAPVASQDVVASSSASPSVVPSQGPITASSTATSTAGWKTYTSNDFSIDYPSGLNVLTSGKQALNASGLDSLVVGFAKNATSSSALTVSETWNDPVNADLYASQLLGLSGRSTTIKAQQENDVSVDGIHAKVIELMSSLDNKVNGTHIIFQSGNVIYEFIGAGDYATGDVLKEFYSSFQFTN